MNNQGVWKEAYWYNVEFLPLTQGTGLTYADAAVRIDSDSNFEFIKTSYMASNTSNANITTGAARVKYRDDTNGRYLMKNGTDLRTIGGIILSGITANGLIPYVWPVPYIIRAATTFTIQAADFENSANRNYRICFHGNKVRKGESPWDKPYRAKIPYVYSMPRSASTLPEGIVRITASQTASVNIPIDIDADFLVYKITGTRTGPALVTVKDGRDRQWSNIATHIDNFLGNGQFPNILTSPRFCMKGSVINITIQDLSASQNDVEINFHGVKIYR